MPKTMRRFNAKVLSVFCAIFLLLSVIAVKPAQAASASLYLSPAVGTYVIGNSFTISVKVNSGGAGINAAEGVINYDTALLDATAVSTGGSIFPFWTTQPVISGGAVRFGGGLPPPVFSGASGHIIKITFKAKKAGQASVRFASGAVLANDGKGTNILASMGSANYTISPKVETPPAENKKPSTTTETTDKKPATQEVSEVEDAAPDYNVPAIKSATHPDQNKWFSGKDVKFNWDLPQGVTAVSIAFDDKSNTDPGSVSDGLFGDKEYKDTADGIWYLHLKFKDSKRWGGIAHYRVMIDATAPKAFAVEIVPGEAGEWPLLRFETTDERSGLDKYVLLVNSTEEKTFELTADKKEAQMADLEIGSHVVIVKALDKAGNEQVQALDLVIPPLPAPTIEKYPEEVKPNDNFFISGKTLANVSVEVFIQKAGGETVSKIVKSDNEGNWFYVNEDELANGRYLAWAKATNHNNISSLESNKVSFLVTPPIFTKIGSLVINYFTVFTSLIFLIVLIIALVIFITGAVKRKLRKETVEIEKVLHDNLSAYQKSCDGEFARLKKYEGKAAYEDEKEKSQSELKKQLALVEKKILKEVRDVEDIVK